MPLNWMRDPGKVGGIPRIRDGLKEMAEYVNSDIGAGVCWELGSFAGESMEIMAPYFKTVHCVDPWVDSCGAGDVVAVERSFDERAALAGNVVKHKIGSVEAAVDVPDGSVDFVYIDAGAHTHEEALRDIKAWWPKVRAGGYIGGHDYPLDTLRLAVHFPGVKSAILEFWGGSPASLRLWDDSSWTVKK